jgi:hypothetical protein
MGVNKMNRIKSFFAIGAFALAMVALPVAASAQWQTRNDPYWSGGNNSRNMNINGTVQSLQSRARSFDRQVSRIDDRRDDRQDDRFGRNRNDQFDDLDQLARNFKNAAENLADEYGRGRNNMNSSRDEAQRVLSIGAQIDQRLGSRNSRVGNRANLESDWRQIDNDLRTIARAYGLNYSGRNGRNRLPF